MRVSYEWLSEYIDLNGFTASEIAEKLTRSGVEVDIVEQRNKGVSGVVVGYVKACDRHPNADKLSVCTVNVGGEEDLQIVCGAANVAAGQKVPVAVVGAVLPGNFKIKRAKLRGVESQGMICSAKELGLNDRLLPKELQDGIYVLPESLELGMDITECLGLDDEVLELDLTPNRSDCLSMIGTAYEIAAILDRELKLPDPEKELNEIVERTDEHISISIASDLCSHYAGRIIDDVQIGPAPQWMQNRLIAAGIRPLNNIVDITNYVMLEYGQPLHAFDYAELQGKQIIVRQAEAGEVLKTLDGEARKLDSSMLVIADAKKPVALAGVMGGADSEVTETTSRIMLESANFAGGTVRQTSKALGLRSESSLRFEKEADPMIVLPALNRAASLMAKYASGKPLKGIAEDRKQQKESVSLTIRLARINDYLGTELSIDDVQDVFNRLAFPFVVEGTSVTVEIPSRRGDITRDVDLIEEVARIYGYDLIPTTRLRGETTQGHLTDEQWLRRKVRHLLLGQGIHESIHYAFTDPKQMNQIAPYFAEAKLIELSMPMSEERSVLRTSLIPHMLTAAEYNIHRGEQDVALFELGKVFVTEQQKLEHLPEEKMMLGILMTGSVTPAHWLEKPRNVDFYDLKGVLDELFRYVDVEVNYTPVQLDGLHPGRTAELSLVQQDGSLRSIGRIAQIHPDVQSQYDLEDTYVCELEWDALVEQASIDVTYQLLPRYPASVRDIAVIVNDQVHGADMLHVIRQEGGSILEQADVFDIYRGENIGNENKSIAFSLRYRHAERTLTDEEITKVHDHILERLKEQFNAELRS